MILVNEEKLVEMSISQLATIASRDWKNVYFGARPYLEAMRSMDSIDDAYGYDDGRSVVRYFLSNAGKWRGPAARLVKRELRRRVG